VNRRILLAHASPILMRAAGHAAREQAAMSVIGRMLEKRTYDLAGQIEPTERPQTAHMQLPPMPKGRFRLALTPRQAERFGAAPGTYDELWDGPIPTTQAA
jgi:hypothetical protein